MNTGGKVNVNLFKKQVEKLFSYFHNFWLYTFLLVWVFAITGIVSVGWSSEEPVELTAGEVRGIYAFHATYRLPQNGRMIPGKANNGRLNIHDRGVPLVGVVGWRPTLHFSLGSICPNSAENTLSDRNHVVIVRVGDLEKQLIGIHPYDSFVLGEFEIPDGSSIIIPQEEVQEAEQLDWVVAKHINLIPRAELIEKQVEGFIKSKNEWIFFGGDEATPPNAIKSNPTDIRFIKSVQRPFFNKFLMEANHVSYGRHTRHLLGFLDSNAHYLLAGPFLRIPGFGEIIDLWMLCATKISDSLVYDEDLRLWFIGKIESIKGICATEKSKALSASTRSKLKKDYFGENDDDLIDYALTWIIKGKYLLHKKAYGVNLGIGPRGIKTKNEASSYLKREKIME